MDDLIPQLMPQEQARQIWAVASERIKDNVYSPTVFRAIEAGVGVTLDGDEFVVGFSNADSPLAGHLRSAQHLSIVEAGISSVVGRKVRLRIIDGTTIDAYIRLKELQARQSDKSFKISEAREKQRAIERVWEDLAERITRRYAKLQGRQFAQCRAEFLLTVFSLINEVYEHFDYENKADDIQKRALARVFERVATSLDIPSTIVAYEFYRAREQKLLFKVEPTKEEIEKGKAFMG